MFKIRISFLVYGILNENITIDSETTSRDFTLRMGQNLR